MAAEIRSQVKIGAIPRLLQCTDQIICPSPLCGVEIFWAIPFFLSEWHAKLKFLQIFHENRIFWKLSIRWTNKNNKPLPKIKLNRFLFCILIIFKYLGVFWVQKCRQRSRLRHFWPSYTQKVEATMLLPLQIYCNMGFWRL